MDYEVCRGCGRYYRAEDGIPRSELVVEKQEARGNYLCKSCTDAKERTKEIII